MSLGIHFILKKIMGKIEFENVQIEIEKVQIEEVTGTARRTFLKDAPHIDGIIKETLSEIASSSKVSQKDEEEHHEDNCFDMFD